MISAWHRFNDRTLARCERAGVPWWGVTAVAFLIGFDISYWLSGRAREKIGG
jgi:hypothetical protein